MYVELNNKPVLETGTVTCSLAIRENHLLLTTQRISEIINASAAYSHCC